MNTSRDNADYPDIDWEALHAACIYALQHLYTASLKEAESAPASATEHCSMAYWKLRDALKPQEKP